MSRATNKRGGTSTRTHVFRLLKAVVFTVLLLGTLAFASAVVKPARVGGAAGAAWEPYLAQDRNSLDVLFFGNSHVFDGIDPITMWRYRGIPGFVLGGPTQRLSISKHYLREALKTQRPKVVVLELSSLNYQGIGKPEFTLVNVGYMPLSANRVAAALEGLEPAERVSGLVDLWAYHSRWDELKDEDWDVRGKNLRSEYLKGYLPQVRIRPKPGKPYEMTAEERAKADAALAESIPQLQEIVRLCREENIELVLLVTPTARPGRYAYHMERAKKAVAGEDHVKIVDLGAAGALPTLSYKTDFFDGGHLTYTGSEKVTKYVADFLAENYGLPDRRADEAYSDWKRDGEMRDEYVEKRLARINRKK